MDARRFLNVDNPFNSTSRAMNGLLIGHDAARGDPLDTTWLAESDGRRVPSAEPELHPMLDGEPIHVTARLARDVYANAIVDTININDFGSDASVKAVTKSFEYESFDPIEKDEIRSVITGFTGNLTYPSAPLLPSRVPLMLSCLTRSDDKEVQCRGNVLSRVPPCLKDVRSIFINRCDAGFRHFGIENLEKASNIVMDVYPKTVLHVPPLKRLRSFSFTTPLKFSRSSDIISGLGNVPMLKSLSIQAGIQQIDGFDGLERLEKLDLSRNRLTSLMGIGNHPLLKKLDISNNLLNVIDGIEHLDSIKEINASNNALGHYNDKMERSGKVLSVMKNLEKLDVSHSSITNDLFRQDPPGFEKLKVLNAKHNFIREVSTITRFPSLEVLDLRENNMKVDWYSDGWNLLHMKKLKRVRFRGNIGLHDKTLETCRKLKEMRPDMVVTC